ncbi:MAG: PadR family transcriptional regulator [Candidatus Bathyarchaeia archaeon]
MTYNRFVAKLTKENLWLYILTELVRQPMYAYELARALKVKYEIQVATVTTYVVLYKMAREGLIRKREGKPLSTKPSRVYYEITDRGRWVLEGGKKFMGEVLRKLSEEAKGSGGA